jgi:hypothetical protein
MVYEDTVDWDGIYVVDYDGDGVMVCRIIFEQLRYWMMMMMMIMMMVVVVVVDNTHYC